MAGADVPDAVRSSVLQLVEEKRATPELGTGAHLPNIDHWIIEQLAALKPEARAPMIKAASAIDDARALFHASIGFHG